MKTPPSSGSRLHAASMAYFLSATAQVYVRLVSFPEAEPVAQLKRSFPRASEPDLNTPFEQAGQLFRRAVWRLNVSVCRPRDLALAKYADAMEGLKHKVGHSRGAAAATLVEQAAEKLRTLEEVDRNPLGQAILAAVSEQGGSAPLIVVPSDEAYEPAARWSRSVGIEANVIHSRHLASIYQADHLVVIGATRWYPDAIVNAPRAKTTEFVQFHWLGAPHPVQGLLPVESEGVMRQISVVGKASTRVLMDPLDLPPSPNWSAVASQGAGVSIADGAEQVVQARPVLLAGDYAALIRYEPGAEVLCAVREEYGINIERVPVDAIEPGMFLPFRTSGSGSDFIKEVADSEFGAAALLGHLETWKSALRRRILELGAKRVAHELRTKGARTANVRYWASPDSIRPRSHHDFRILLEYLGFVHEGPALMEAADQVFGAHIEAGHYVRRLLEERIGDADLDQTGGVFRIELEQGDGGALSVFRVIRVADEEFSVPESAVKQPFPLQEAAWLA